MPVHEIIEVKSLLDELTSEGLIQSWELPHENILTRRTAAVFFLTPTPGLPADSIWESLSRYEGFTYRMNEEKKLSKLKFRISFSR